MTVIEFRRPDGPLCFHPTCFYCGANILPADARRLRGSPPDGTESVEITLHPHCAETLGGILIGAARR